MSPADRLIAARSARARNLEVFNIDLMPGEPWSYQVDDSSLFLLTLREDLDSIECAETDIEVLTIYEQIRPFIETFHVGEMN